MEIQSKPHAILQNTAQVPFKLNNANPASQSYKELAPPGQNDFLKAFTQARQSEHIAGKDQEKDILLESPLRALAYTNEIGVALKPAIGTTLSHAFWAPALMYFGADIWDKYKRGEDDSYQNNDKRTALRQTIFHAVASLVGPTVAILGAQYAAMKKAGGEKWINTTLKKINMPDSSLASKIEKFPLGKSLVSILKRPSAGKKLLSVALETVVGLAALALVAIPLDILTEKILIKKVVNPSLRLKDQD